MSMLKLQLTKHESINILLITQNRQGPDVSLAIWQLQVFTNTYLDYGMDK